MADHLSPRVNSARLPDYLQHTVRLTGKILRFQDATNEAIVAASDGGEVRVKLIGNVSITSTYVEIIGTVTGNDSLKAQALIDLGDNLDLSLVDFVVEKWHDPKFQNMV